MQSRQGFRVGVRSPGMEPQVISSQPCRQTGTRKGKCSGLGCWIASSLLRSGNTGRNKTKEPYQQHTEALSYNQNKLGSVKTRGQAGTGQNGTEARAEALPVCLSIWERSVHHSEGVGTRKSIPDCWAKLETSSAFKET